MKKILLVMFMVLFTAAAGFCGEFENTLKKAERGDVEAQYILGLRYYEGEKYDSQSNIDFSFLEDPRWQELDDGTRSKMIEAAFVKNIASDPRWYSLSDDHKQAMFDSYFQSAKNYEKAFYSKDYEKAVYWFTKAAKRGHSLAQLFLGGMHEEGKGIKQDFNQAVFWYTKSAEQGEVEAQYVLGRMHDIGKGVVQNFRTAYIWFSLAASQGDTLSARARDRTAKKLSHQQLAEAQDLAAKKQRRIPRP